LGYDINQFLAGMIRTSGIARFVDKFDMQLTELPINGYDSYLFTLKPKSSADFRFYVVQHPDVCPSITRRAVGEQVCSFDFFFTGTGVVAFGGQVLTFTNSYFFNATVDTSDDPYNLSVNGQGCLSINCRQTVNSTYMLLETPSFSVVSQDDMNLATVTYSLDTLMANSLETLSEIEANATQAKANIDQIMTLLATIDFNVSKLFPYEDFTNLRASVDQTVAKVGTDYCSGPFDSIQCWLKSSASILIACAVIVVVGAIVTFICVKTGYAKKLKAKICNGEDEESGYGSPKKGVKEDIPGDFQLIGATN